MMLSMLRLSVFMFISTCSIASAISLRSWSRCCSKKDFSPAALAGVAVAGEEAIATDCLEGWFRSAACCTREWWGGGGCTWSTVE